MLFDTIKKLYFHTVLTTNTPLFILFQKIHCYFILFQQKHMITSRRFKNKYTYFILLPQQAHYYFILCRIKNTIIISDTVVLFHTCGLMIATRNRGKRQRYGL